ncbi:MAG: hypothetical protein ACRDT8_11085 [Micromonosporaceae bacterium]
MRAKIRTLLDELGTTYAEQAGIRLKDTPAPLYQLLVLTVLLSHRIQGDIAVAACRELNQAGTRTPQRMREATWQQRVDALGRGHFVRYDESTATALGDGAQFVLDAYQGDLRRMRREADGDVKQLRGLLQKVPNIGPTGAHIFCREVQAVWPELRPYLDRKALQGAERLGLPADAEQLAEHVSAGQLAALAAALVRVALDPTLSERVS